MGQSAACKKTRMLLEAQNSNIDSKCFSRKQNVSSDNVRNLTLTQAFISSLTLPHFAITSWSQKQKCNSVYIFCLLHFTLTDLSKNTGLVFFSEFKTECLYVAIGWFSSMLFTSILMDN